MLHVEECGLKRCELYWSNLSRPFCMKIEKRALRFVSLPCLYSLKFTCIHSIWSVASLVVSLPRPAPRY